MCLGHTLCSASRVATGKMGENVSGVLVALGCVGECELQGTHFVLSLGEARPSSLTQRYLLLLCCSGLHTLHIWHQTNFKGTACSSSSKHLVTC